MFRWSTCQPRLAATCFRSVSDEPRGTMWRSLAFTRSASPRTYGGVQLATVKSIAQANGRLMLQDYASDCYAINDRSPPKLAVRVRPIADISRVLNQFPLSA